MKELTRAEEEIMQVLWEIEKGFVRDVIDRLPDPKPAYTTVSTIIRILEKKGFVGHKAFGKTHRYFPLVEKKGLHPPTFPGYAQQLLWKLCTPDGVFFLPRQRSLHLRPGSHEANH
jgi:predicted transcriptional regulator